jgi:hypothetical protein
MWGSGGFTRVGKMKIQNLNGFGNRARGQPSSDGHGFSQML